MEGITLPQQFLTRMQHQMGEEYDAFLRSYEQEKVQGLRLNELKGTREQFLSRNPFTLMPVPWEENGFYYPETERPGKHPYHDAGVYYIQEPSAMAVARLAAPKPGENVLDLCAAPGGKTTHLASQMKGEGLLVANEIHPARVKILSQNVERMGVPNAVVTNENSYNLATRFPEFFHCIVVDAPCSGEGMFRKDEIACREWSEENVKLCAERQKEILDHAAAMLRPGGRLVYSTCTFAPAENEGSMSQFVKRHPEFETDHSIEYEKYYAFGFDKGYSEFEESFRLFPHKMKGEGHFIAILRKTEGLQVKAPQLITGLKDKKMLSDWEDFQKKLGLDLSNGAYQLFGDQLYLVPEQMIDLKGLKVLRPGLHLGTLKKNRFEPSHSLALALSADKTSRCISFSKDSREILSYLKGETVTLSEQTKPAEKGWNLICVEGYSVGWGKVNQNMIKNHYPKGLRWLY